jgi:hypothetical protein
VPRLNQLQSVYGPDGLQVLSVNYTNTDTEIQDFITTFGANYSIASVADSGGYTVPIFSTCFAIDRNGTVLWTGTSDQITDQMVEDWLGFGDSVGEDKDESCSTSEHNGWALAVVALALLATVSRQGAKLVRPRTRKQN